jgi:phosphoserine aminotransferase
MKKYNFNAGPSMLPREVIENTAKQILDFNGSNIQSEAYGNQTHIFLSY